tara:strand:- start:381 stop:1136 length:756 start_codon:yes stop_codon:yes gene_type:complete
MSQPELDPATRSTLRELNLRVATYEADQSVTDAIASSRKKVTPVIGGVAVGKTSITSLVTELDPTIRPINTTTSRSRKPSDPAGFRTASEGVTLEHLVNDIVDGEVVNYTVIEGTGTIYATYLDGFPGEYSIGPIVSDNIPVLQRSRFDQCRPTSIITPADAWAGFIQESLGERSDAIINRIPETIASLTYAKKHLDSLYFVENSNQPGGREKAAAALINITKGDGSLATPKDRAEEVLTEMLHYAQSLAR